VSRARADDGLTLVELLVTVAITALVLPVLGATMVVGYRTTDATVVRLEDTRDRQIVPALFTGDMQSATTVDATSAAGCPLGGGTLVLRLSRRETSLSGTVVTRVAAWLTTASAGTTLLERRSCDDASGAMALVGAVTTAHGVVGSPGVTCRTSAGATTACAAASAVARVDLLVTDASGPFTVTARRRAAP